MGWKTHLKGKKFLEKLGAKKAGIQLSPFLEHLKEYSVYIFTTLSSNLI